MRKIERALISLTDKAGIEDFASQLQEMAGQGRSIDAQLRDLLQWMEDPWGYGEQPFKRHWPKLEAWAAYIKSLVSMEQLWLAFVMKELHGKVWDGENWRKE